MHRLRRRTGAAAVTMTAVLALGATACGGKNDTDASASRSPSPVASNTAHQPGFQLPKGLPKHLPKGLPTSLKDLEKWKHGDWKNWKNWATAAHKAEAFANPVIKHLWTVARTLQAKPVTGDQVPASVAHDKGRTDEIPDAVAAKAVAAPYHLNQGAVGKVFFDSPEGPAECSGTVITDPEHPGKSNLVWTAGHCAHGGADGGWYRNITFVPSYNNQGLSDSQLRTASVSAVEPYGVWWADKARTSSQWISRGSESSTVASPWDYSVLHVQPENPHGKSLQETVGGAVPVWFDAPSASGLSSLTAFGYPAAPPFNGYRMFDCPDKPSRLSLAATAPTEYWIGCTMTAGSSGGGWLAKEPDGRMALVSNTSIGPRGSATWLAGPYLGSNARKVFDSMEQAIR